jgi:hypothetical protein
MMKIPASELAGFRSWLNGQSDELKQDCKALIVDVGMEFIGNAKNDVNVYRSTHKLGKAVKSRGGRTYKPKMKKKGPHGRLMSSIKPRFSSDGLSAEFVADTNYAAYQEFGTGDKVKIEPGYEDYAATFRGAGIKRVNIPPKSYFFGNFERANKRLINELKKMGFK